MTAPWSSISGYLLNFSHLYPGISTWSLKVRAGLATGNRSVIGLLDPESQLAGIAITKNGRRAKLCHISISDSSRAVGSGRALMRAAVMEMLENGAGCVRVTTSEEVASSYGDFFKRNGFMYWTKQSGRYRSGVDELEWLATRESLSYALALGMNNRPRLRGVPTSHQVFARLVWAPEPHRLVWEPFEDSLRRIRGVVNGRRPT